MIIYSILLFFSIFFIPILFYLKLSKKSKTASQKIIESITTNDNKNIIDFEKLDILLGETKLNCSLYNYIKGGV